MSVLFIEPGDLLGIQDSFATHSERVLSVQRQIYKGGGKYIDGAPRVLKLSRPFFLIRLQIYNDTVAVNRRVPGYLERGAVSLSSRLALVVGAAPFTWRIKFSHERFVEENSFPYTRTPLMSVDAITRPFQISDNVAFQSSGSLSDGWWHSLTLHLLADDSD